jgi:hypothetical protein
MNNIRSVSRRSLIIKTVGVTFYVGASSFFFGCTGNNKSIDDSKQSGKQLGEQLGEQLNDKEIAVLASLAFYLLPVRDKNDAIYQTVAAKVSKSVKGHTEQVNFFREGVRSLILTADLSWFSISAGEQILRVKAIEGSAFFSRLRALTTEVVLRDPLVWKRLGYQGSAIEHGGYLHRGFDDISWLPANSEGVKQ